MWLRLASQLTVPLDWIWYIIKLYIIYNTKIQNFMLIGLKLEFRMIINKLCNKANMKGWQRKDRRCQINNRTIKILPIYSHFPSYS